MTPNTTSDELQAIFDDVWANGTTPPDEMYASHGFSGMTRAVHAGDIDSVMESVWGRRTRSMRNEREAAMARTEISSPTGLERMFPGLNLKGLAMKAKKKGGGKRC